MKLRTRIILLTALALILLSVAGVMPALAAGNVANVMEYGLYNYVDSNTIAPSPIGTVLTTGNDGVTYNPPPWTTLTDVPYVFSGDVRIGIKFAVNVATQTYWSANQACFHLYDSAGNPVSINVTRAGDGSSGDVNKDYIFVAPQDVLKSSTTYKIIIDPTLTSNNGLKAGKQQEIDFTTAADTTVPTWPEGSALTVSDKSQTGLTLSWTSASDDLAVDAYQVYKDGALLDTVYGATTYNVTGLNPGTEYTFKVEAGDAAGNWTTVGLSATATTDNASVNVSLVLDKSSAGIGGKVTASGTADPNKWVTIEVLDSGQNIVVFDGVKSDAEGNYSVTFLVPDSAKGTLTIVAGYGSNVATASLTVTPVEPPAPKYTVTAQGDPIYDNGVNADGITTLTVHSGVSGFKYFGVTIMPVTEHEGDERWYLFT